MRTKGAILSGRIPGGWNSVSQLIRLTIVLAPGLLLLLFLAGCSSDEPEDSRQRTQSRPTSSLTPGDRVYRLPLMLSPATLDPAYLQDQYGISVAVQLFDGLIQFGPYLSLQPAVAKSWSIADNGKTFVFQLRPGVSFHNGRNVTASDVVFSLERLVKANPAPSILPHLLKIEGAAAFRQGEHETLPGLKAIDPLKVSIHLTEPHAPLLNALAMYQAAIVPQDIVQRQAEMFGRAPIGCGPFRFKRWIANSSIELERYPQYYNGPAHLAGVEFKLYPEANIEQITRDFSANKLEEMPVLGDVRQQLQPNDKYRWEHRPSLSLLFYGINTAHSSLSDSRFRKALSLSIDRVALVQKVYHNQFGPAHTLLPPGMPARYQQENQISEDTTLARQLLTEIRRDNPSFQPEVEIVTASSSAFAQAELDFIEKSWAAIGIRVTRKIIPDWAAFEQYLRSDLVQVYRYSWTADIPDPDNFLRPLFSSNSPDNYTRAVSPEIDRLLDQASSLVDDMKRAELYRTIEQQTLQFYTVLPLFYLSIDRVYQSTVEGIQLTALGTHTARLNRVTMADLP